MRSKLEPTNKKMFNRQKPPRCDYLTKILERILNRVQRNAPINMTILVFEEYFILYKFTIYVEINIKVNNEW